MQIETVALNALTAHPENAREHPDRQVRALAHCLRKWGQRRPVVATRDLVILAGHGLVEAAASLGWASIEVLFVDSDTDDQLRYMLADNRVAQLSRWKPSTLRSVLDRVGRQAELFTADEINAIDRVQPLERGSGEHSQSTKSWMHRRAKQTDTTAGLIGDVECRLSNDGAAKFCNLVRSRATAESRPVRVVAQEMIEAWIASL